LEFVERLGEVDNVGDLEKYGYGFFNVEKQWFWVFIFKR
jgi:hypothetical protein